MTANDLNHCENGVRKLGDPTSASAPHEVPTQGPATGLDPERRADPEEGGKVRPAEGDHDAPEALPPYPEADAANPDAIREASRLGSSDAYLVDQDMEDLDERQGRDGLDGRPSPLANAANPQR